MTKSKYGYGDLIRKARETDSQEVIEPENQLAVKPDNQMTDQPVKQTEDGTENQNTIKQENQPTVEPDNQITGKPEHQIKQEREVNLCVKVPESLRRHWAAESKRHGITMTEVIIQALKERFGSPN